MSQRLSPEQVAEVVEALAPVCSSGARGGPRDVVRALRASSQTAFSGAEVDGIDAAVSMLDRPLEARPPWPTAKGRGLFLVFEGLDRSGKSTQSKQLAKRLGEEVGPVRWTCFPNRETAVGTLIDLYLRREIELPDETVHQLFSANRWEVAASIVEDLGQGTSIVCDRYAFSGVAYSVAKGLDFAWCQAPDCGLPVPDGVFFLHVDAEVGASRANFGDERYENATMQAQVREEFRRPELRVGVNWHDVDGARDIEEIHTEIYDAVSEARQAEQENGARPLRRLWAA